MKSNWQKPREAIERVPYLAISAFGVPFGVLASALFPTEPLVRGHSLAVVLPLSCTALSVLVWLMQPSTRTSRSLYRFPLSVYGAVWLVFLFLTLRDELLVDYRVLAVPIVLIMVALKPPNRSQLLTSMSALSWAIVIVLGAHFLYEVLEYGTAAIPGVMVPGTSIYLGSPQRLFGAWGNPNLVGPVGAYIAVFGLFKRGFSGWLFFVVGLLTIAVAGTQSGLLAFLVGGSVLWIFDDCFRLWPLTRTSRVVLTTSFLVFIVAIATYLQPTYGERTRIWGQYLDFWLTQPVGGVGTSAIQAGLASGELQPWYVHGHNIWLDAAGRYGLMGLLPIALLVGVWTWINIKGAVGGSGLGLALLAVFTAVGVFEVDSTFLYWSVPTLFLFLGLLTSVASRPNKNLGRQQLVD